jgi:hypothetical protein
MTKTILSVVFGATIASTALAQTSLSRSQEREAIETITAIDGATCERIVRTQTIGQLDDRSTLMAVACSGGEEEHYVVQLDQRGNMSFYATCKNLAVATNNEVRCFR